MIGGESLPAGSDAAVSADGMGCHAGAATMEAAARAAGNSELLDGTEYMIFPHVLIWPSTSNPLFYRFRPGETPDTCLWETSLYLKYTGEQPEPGPIIKLEVGEPMRDIAELGYVGPILQQDCDNLEFIQAGMKASGTGVLQVARYQESRLRHYHNTIDRYLGD